HGLLEALGAERLQQVVERAQLERGDRVAIVGRGEDDERPVTDLLEDLEPGHSRHLDVEEEEVGLELVDGAHGLFPVRGLADALEPGDLGGQLAEAPPRDGFVVGDDGRDLPHETASLARKSAGRVTVTSKPAPGAVRISIAAWPW